jgi:hypothetical protein
MKYFIDTEFIEDGHTIDLISIGIVGADGRELYCESQECKLSFASDWVKENVIPHLWHLQTDKRAFNLWQRECHTVGGLKSRRDIARDVKAFCDPEKFGKPEFWGWFADYDWVALCQLFGTMTDLPAGWPMYCRDLKQWCDDLGNPRLPPEGKNEHNALADARWNFTAYRYLEDFVARSTELPSKEQS